MAKYAGQKAKDKKLRASLKRQNAKGRRQREEIKSTVFARHKRQTARCGGQKSPVCLQARLSDKSHLAPRPTLSSADETADESADEPAHNLHPKV